MKTKSKNGFGGQLVFHIEAKIMRHAFVDIDLLCNFGEFMFINKGGMEPFGKCDEQTYVQTYGHCAFYNLPSRAYRPAGDKNR